MEFRELTQLDADISHRRFNSDNFGTATSDPVRAFIEVVVMAGDLVPAFPDKTVLVEFSGCCANTLAK